MSTRFLLHLLIAAMLTGGLAAGPRAAEAVGPEERAAALVAAEGQYASAALPAQGLLAEAAAELDAPGTRTLPSGPSARYRTSQREAHAPRAQPSQSNEQQFCDMAARLLRSGMDSSSLNTPPPQS